MDNKEKDNYRKLQQSKMQRFQKAIFQRILDFIGVSCFLFCVFAINDILPQYDCNYCIGIGVATLLGSIIGGATSGISSAVSGKMNRRSLRYNKEQAELNRHFQSAEADKAREWQEAIYNRYESPYAMVRQYLDAGLNPALMYGSASSGSMPSTSVPSGSMASAPSMQMPDFSGLLSIAESMLNLSRTEAEIKNIKSVTEKTEQETSNLLTTQELIDSNIKLNNITVDKVRSEIDNNRATLKEIASRIDLNTIDYALKNYQIDEIQSKIRLNTHQSELILSQIGLNSDQMDKIKAEIGNLIADTDNKKKQKDLFIAQTFLSQAQKSLLENQSKNAEYERIGISYDNFYKYVKALNSSTSGLAETPTGIVGGLYSIIAGIACSLDINLFNSDPDRFRVEP